MTRPPAPDAAALVPLPQPRPTWWLLLSAGLALALLVDLGALLAPALLGLPRYDVSGGQIVARSVLSRTVIPASTPAEATVLDLRRKSFGSDLPSYVVGRFDTDRGQVAVYSDGSRRGLLLATIPPTFITPADPAALLAARASGAAATFQPARAAGTDRPSLGLALLVVPPILAAAWSVLLRRPRLSYTVTGDSLTIRTQASTTALPRQGTAARLTPEPLGLRQLGTSVPGYHTGTFRLRGGPVQAAASQARPTQALLLDHAGKTYYLTPSDPAAVAAWFAGGRGT